MTSHKLEYRQDAAGGGASAATRPAAPIFVSPDLDLPDYLVRYYRWAYLWPFAVWFFDHQPIINAILFGNYRRIMNETRRLMEPDTAGRTLQIAAVYGMLTPTLAADVEELHLAEIAPVQIKAVERKLARAGQSARVSRMNAECLHYERDSFDTALMFLLLHELTPEARGNSLREAIRVLRPGGRFVVAEYGETRRRHFFHRFAPMRWVLTKAEPFLEGFWNEDLTQTLAECAAETGKGVELEEHVDIFGGFYRVMRFRVTNFPVSTGIR